MSRLAAERTTHLTPPEIITEALRQFDAGPNDPSIRSLASALGVAPAAIYHHFSSQADIWQGAVASVWDEVFIELVRLVPDPFAADPVDTLVAAGLATRRAWLAHHRLSRFMAATPSAVQWRSNTISLMAAVFEKLGLRGEEAGRAFHAYATFMLGAVLYAAANRTANEQLAEGEDQPGERFGSRPEAAWAEYSSEETRQALETVTEFSVVDPVRDEELFADGLRRIITSFTAERPEPRRPASRAKTRGNRP